MKLNFIKSIILALGCSVIIACDDATEIKAKYSDDFLNPNKSEAYYEALRQYKKTDHAVAFGWYGNWTGVGASLANCMESIPDSVDFISMWGGWKNPSAEMLADLRLVQQKKGTKALICFIVLDCGDQLTPSEYANSMEAREKYWGWVDGDTTAIRKAISKYANAICDTIDKYNYDGFDLDWEPSYQTSTGTNKKMVPYVYMFVEELSKRIGPASGTDKLFVIDGEPAHDDLRPENGKLFNYYIAQAYSCTSYNNLDSRCSAVIRKYKSVMPITDIAKKFIATENFESYASTGGVSHRTRQGTTVPSLEGMALWNPMYSGVMYRKGGAGSYHMEYEYTVAGKNGTYPYLRKAIQIMNPAIQ